MERTFRLLAMQGSVGILVLLSFTNVTAEEAAPIWQLAPGQIFSVQSTTHRVTEIQVGDHRELSNVTDQTTLRYTMFGFDRQGRAQFEVQIESLDRVTKDKSGKETSESLVPERALRSPATAIAVSDDGKTVQVLGRRSIFRTDSLLSQKLLNQLSSEGVFESWLDMPFRIPVKTTRAPFTPAEPQENETEPQNDEAIDNSIMRLDSDWTRTQHISLGLPGTVECKSHYVIEAINKQTAQVRINGTLQLKQRQSPEDDPLRILDFKFNSSDMSGEGHIQLDEFTGLPQSIQMTQTMTLDGRSTVTTGDVSQEMQFKQTLTFSWTASEFRLQDISLGVPIQIQQQR